jgi:putative endonuclease
VLGSIPRRPTLAALQTRAAFFMVGCYILHSKKLNRYYIGVTQEDITSRIEKHNNHSYGEHRFTAKANDWVLFIFIEAIDFSQAVRIEKKVKSMKSAVYIQNLKKYPEMIEKLMKL